MKKQIAVLALLAATTSGYAASTVYSANIVGFVKTTVPASGFSCVGVNFVSDTGEGMTLSDIFGNQLTGSASPALCDAVYLWDAVNQEYIQVGLKNDGKFYKLTDWSGLEYNPIISNGTALWVKSSPLESSDREIVLSGNVPLSQAVTNSVVGDAGMPFNFIANPYPVTKPLNEILNTTNLVASAVPVLCDQVYLWDVSTQQYVQLGLKPDNNWYKLNDWGGAAQNLELTQGQGLWLRSHNAVDLTFEKPF